MPSLLESMFSQQQAPTKATGALDRLRSTFSPSSTAGKVSSRDLYNEYSRRAADSDEPLISFEDFLTQMQQYQTRGQK